MTDLPLSAKQVESVRDADGRVNIWEGAIRSGKTIGSLIRFLIAVATAPRHGQIVIIGRTRDAIWRNVIAPLQDGALFGTVAAHVVGNYGAPTVTILGRRCFLLGASDVKAEKVLRGLTVALAYVDEITAIPEEFFTQLLGRMSVRGAQLFGTTNPDNPAHWLKAKFLDRLAELLDWRRFHFTLDDNPSLTAEYVESVKREFTGLWYRRFILGEWVAAEGAVYSMWNPDRNVIAYDRLPQMQQLLAVGIDWGTTNPSAGILLGLGADRRLYAVDEWWMKDLGKGADVITTGRQSESLRAWMADGRAPEWVIVDPSAKAFRNQLFQDGVTSQAAYNNVTKGISIVATLLADDTLRISDRCTNLIREIPGYSWDPKATEKGEDKPIKIDDHAADALRYSVATTEALWRGQIIDTAREAA